MGLSKKLVVVVTLAALVSGCSKDEQQVTQRIAVDQAAVEKTTGLDNQNQAFLMFAQELAQIDLAESPTTATSLGIDDATAGYHFGDKLDAMSVEDAVQLKARHATISEKLQQFDPSQLTGTALTTFQVLSHSLAITKKFKPYINGAYRPLVYYSLFPVSQISGPQVGIPRLLQTKHPLATEQDARDYIARLHLIEPRFSDLAELVKWDAEQGILLPTFAVEGTLNLIQQLTTHAPADHPLVTSFQSRLANDSDLAPKQITELTQEVIAAVKGSVYSGYAKLRVALEAIMPVASTNAGIWDLKNGAQLYQLALENYGASGKTAEEIHQLGLSEVARIQQEMAGILRGQNLDASDVIASFNQLSEDPKYLYPNTDKGRQQLLDDLNGQMQTVTEMLPQIMKTLPKAGVEVRRIAKYEQDSAPGGYYTTPALDGSRPGIYWINLKDTADWPKFTLPTLTYHEASPGHHLQIAIAQEIQDLPLIRNMIWFSSFGEGWALYAEVLAKEMGLYDDNPLGDLGRLQSELFRAARLVVDTGLHHKRWSREQAIDYMYNTVGGSKAAITREIERYAVWPGQACSYKLGQLKILELREQAKAKLGDKFDLAEFNNQVIIHGAISLAVLEQKITAWLAGQEA